MGTHYWGVLLILLRDPDEANNGILRIEWLAAAHSALAQRALRQLRHDRISDASISQFSVSMTSSAGSSRDVDWESVRSQQQQNANRRRLQNAHANMLPEQIQRHRDRNAHSNMSPEQISRHRRQNTHEDMSPDQTERHRCRNLHEEMDAEQVAMYHFQTCLPY